MCLAQEHNAVTPVRLEPVAPRSQVKHSTTEVCTLLEHIPNKTYPVKGFLCFLVQFETFIDQEVEVALSNIGGYLRT